MAPPRFSLRTLLATVILVSVVLAVLATAVRVREEAREAAADDAAFARLIELFSGTRPPLSSRDAEEVAPLLRRMLRSEHGAQRLRALDARSPHIVVDPGEHAVYCLTTDWWSIKWPSYGLPHGPWYWLSRVGADGRVATVDGLFAADSFDPELTVEGARAFFNDPQCRVTAR